MSTQSIQAFQTSLINYMPYVLLTLGNFGCVCNFITFTSKQLRRNSCAWYFLMSALFDFAYINFGLFTKLSTDAYGSTLQNTILAWCRMRVFLTWTLPCIATGFLLLASLDRCLSTFRNARLRSFSQLKVAYWLTPTPIILYSATTSHQFVYYDFYPKCASQPGTYSYFLGMYSIFWTSLIPQGAMLLFAVVTYYNIKKSRQRLANNPNQQTSRTNSQLITITLFQVLCSSILLNIRTAYYTYTRFVLSVAKDPYRLAIENLLTELTSYIFYSNFCKSFFINTLSSKLFRQVFRQRMMNIFHQLTCRRAFRVRPVDGITMTMKN